MAGDDRADGNVGAGGGMHTTAPDARLTELLRADTPTAYPALRELRTRHRPAVLRYARLCTVSEDAARQLTAQAFALAARETARGIDPRGPWRHQLLLLTGRVAAAWASDDRGSRLDPGLLTLLGETGADGPVLPAPDTFGAPSPRMPGASQAPLPPMPGTFRAPQPPMLNAFHSLPARVQGVIWYGLVEAEPDARAAAFAGCTPEDVRYGTESALQALRQACLKTCLARSGNPRCQDFRRLIEEAAHPENPRYSADLHAHMTHCAHCAAAYEELGALRDTPRTALADGLLPWGGGAYALGGAVGTPGARGAAVSWLPSRRVLLASAALGVALAPLLLLLLTSGGSEQGQAVSAVRTPAAPPAVTVTATVSATPSPSPTAKSPSPTRTSKSPKPAPAKPKPTPSPTHASSRPPNGQYAQVVNADSGLCLDIRDGVMDLGTDVITAPCTSSRTQMWRVDSDRGVLQSYADPDFCLDSRGSTDKGVGIWECSSVYGRNGMNLRFTVDTRGVIRPAIAPDHAVTPYGSGLVLSPDRGGNDQRWLAGAGAS